MSASDDDPSWDLFDVIPSGDDELVALVHALLGAEPRPFLPLTLDEDRADIHDLSGFDEVDLEEVRLGSVAVLRDGYGEPVGDAEELRCSDSGKAVRWRVGESTLVLQLFVEHGDGDIELHLWLAAVADQVADHAADRAG
jgi:hypothetical protein